MKKYIINATGTTSLKVPYPFNSWVEYWSDNSNFNLPTVCPACGQSCIEGQLDGCHVYIIHSELIFCNKLFLDHNISRNDFPMYIVPLCKSCNHKPDIFSVDEELLIPAP